MRSGKQKVLPLTEHSGIIPSIEITEVVGMILDCDIVVAKSIAADSIARIDNILDTRMLQHTICSYNADDKNQGYRPVPYMRTDSTGGSLLVHNVPRPSSNGRMANAKREHAPGLLLNRPRYVVDPTSGTKNEAPPQEPKANRNAHIYTGSQSD